MLKPQTHKPMLTFGIRYLCGSVVASDVADRSVVEWPPHPARVFMALAAAHFQTGDDPAERTALEWLEQQPAPLITAGAPYERPAVTTYVPVNDSPGDKKTPIASAPGMTRLRQPRTFARAWLEDDTVWLHWPQSDVSAHLEALSALCEKVTRIGHSTSLVQMWASDQPAPLPTWEPSSTGRHPLRTPGAGSLAGLEERFNRDAVNEFHALQLAAADADVTKKQHDAAKKVLAERYPNGAPLRQRPEINLSETYRQVAEADFAPSAPGTVFDPNVIAVSLRRIDGPFRQLGLTATLDLTKRCRDAILKHLDGHALEALTGHDPQTGGRSEKPHLAILPLAFVGHEHASGDVLGLGFALPKKLLGAERQTFLRALARLRATDLCLGEKGRWGLLAPDERDTLRASAWTAGRTGATHWATVTPYVYDRHAKAKDKAAYQQELADSIRSAWERVRDSENPAKLEQVIIVPVSAHLGAPPAHVFPRVQRKDGSVYRHSHAILVFDQAVTGPIFLGAGRYKGYGLCRPM